MPKVRRLGRSLIVTIPHDLVEGYGIVEGQKVIWHPDKSGPRLQFVR